MKLIVKLEKYCHCSNQQYKRIKTIDFVKNNNAAILCENEKGLKNLCQ